MSVQDSPLQPVVHLRVKRYVGAYIKCIYGGEPLMWPTNHAVSLILESSLVIDDDINTIPHGCITDRMWRLAEEQARVKQKGTRQMDLFAEEFELTGNTSLVEDWESESQNYITLQLPEVGIRRGGNLRSNDITKISRRGASAIVDTLDREFWIEMFRFVSEQRFLAAERNHSIRLDDILEDFFCMYAIPLSEKETVTRVFRRERKRLKEEIAMRRKQVNPDMADMLHEGRPLSARIAREEREQREASELHFVGGEAISNVREYVPQKRGI